MRTWTENRIRKNLPNKSSILICGITYKNNTMSVKNSLSLFLLKKLDSMYDITILEKNKKLNNFVKNNMVNNLLKNKKKFDAIIFVNSMYDPKYLKLAVKKDTLYIDPYGFFKKYFINKSIRYLSIGNN